jgi:hypothetical protein
MPGAAPGKRDIVEDDEIGHVLQCCPRGMNEVLKLLRVGLGEIGVVEAGIEVVEPVSRKAGDPAAFITDDLERQDEMRAILGHTLNDDHLALVCLRPGKTPVEALVQGVLCQSLQTTPLGFDWLRIVEDAQRQIGKPHHGVVHPRFAGSRNDLFFLLDFLLLHGFAR